MTWCKVAEDDVTRYLDILDVGRTSVIIRLAVDELEGSICLIAAWNDEPIGGVVGADSKGLSAPDEG